MTASDQTAQSVVIDRYLAHGPAKVWQALTESDLLARWLMTNDFKPVVGHQFHLRSAPNPRWDGLTACQVLEVTPPSRLSYSCTVTGEREQATLSTTVTWSLTPTPDGTLLRMEQSGFGPSQQHNRRGAAYGWGRYLNALSALLARLP